MAALVLADRDSGQLSPSTAPTVNAALAFGPVDLLLAGHGLDAAAEAAARLDGVRTVRVADTSSLAFPTAEQLAPLLAQLAPDYAAIVASAGSLGRDVIPRLAARLDLMPVTDVVAIHGSDRFDRPIYAGNAIETVVSRQALQLLTVRTSAFRPVGQGGSAARTSVAADLPARVTQIAEHRTPADTPDLAGARIVVGGGIAVGSAEGFGLIAQLAARLGAAIGATRAAVDAGYAPNDWQVGQTGKIIAPDLYIAIGISGALQHLAGIQGARTIVAINIDPDAPLMQLADYALAGDLFTVVPALIAELDRLGVEKP